PTDAETHQVSSIAAKVLTQRICRGRLYGPRGFVVAVGSSGAAVRSAQGAEIGELAGRPKKGMRVLAGDVGGASHSARIVNPKRDAGRPAQGAEVSDGVMGLVPDAAAHYKSVEDAGNLVLSQDVVVGVDRVGPGIRGAGKINGAEVAPAQDEAMRDTSGNIPAGYLTSR